MTTPQELRGRVKPARRAREVVLWATSGCERVRALGAAGTSGRAAAAHLVGADPYDYEIKASPFGAEAGFNHEARLLLDAAERVRALYLARLGIDISADRVAVLIAWGGARPSEEDEVAAHAQTERLVQDCLTTRDPRPMLIAQARLWVHHEDTDDRVKPDLLVWDGRRWRVAEMKAYIDLGGYTDATSVASAVRQAAVSVVALRQLAGAGADAAITNDIDLIFRRRGGGGASLRVMDASAEIQSIEATMAYAAQDRERYLAMTGGARLDTLEGLSRIPMRFVAHCRESCGLANVCEKEQSEDHSPRYGKGIEELAEVGITAARAAALARGAEPESAAERRAAFALQAAWRSSR